MKINEDVFQIAYYLYENGHISGDQLAQRGVVRTALGKIIDDFDSALTELEVKGYCKRITAGEDDGVFVLMPAGITFVQENLSNRMKLEYDAQLLLKRLYKDYEDGFPWAGGDFIQGQMGWIEKRFRRAALALGDEGFIRGSAADNNPYFQIQITSEGRKAIRANFQLPTRVAQQVYTGNITNITGDNNIVSSESILSHVNQTVEASSAFSDSDKDELKDLLDQLTVLLQSVPENSVEEAEAVAEMAKNLVQVAAKEKPNKPLIKITANGLKIAATNIAVIVPQVLTTALAIIAFVDKIHP